MSLIEAFQKIDSKIPEFKEIGNGFMVTAFSISHKKITQKNGGLNGGLNEKLAELLDTIGKNPGIQAKALSSLLNRPLDTVDKQIKGLIKGGYIIRKGSRKTGGYHRK